MLSAASFIRSSGRSWLGRRRLHDGAWWDLPQHTWRRRLGWQMCRLHAGGFRLCLEGWRLGLSRCLREKRRGWLLLSRRSRRTRRGRGSWEAWRSRRKHRRRRKQITRASLPRLWHMPRIIIIAIPICRLPGRLGMCDRSSHHLPDLRSGSQLSSRSSSCIFGLVYAGS